MKKAYLILAVLAISLGLQAQNPVKLGHLNTQELLLLMPERADAEAKLNTLSTQLEGRLKVLSTEYQSKIQGFQALPADTPQSTVEDMRGEIVAMEKRITDFRTNAQNDLGNKEDELVQPMIEKLQKAIDAVGAENGFTYIFDLSAGSVVYQNSDDITALVKTKLGITN
jgi:outer membrane protein